MTSKIVVNNIESDAGISSVTLVSNIAGEDSTQNISGINSVTATTFHGDGSQLSGISVDSTKIETGNTKVETIDTGSDGHIKFTTEGGERSRISSDGHLGINTDFTGSQLWRAGKRLEIFGGSGNVTGELHLGANRGDGTQSVGSINFFDNTQDTSHKHVAVIEVDKAGSTSNKRGGDLIFYTKNDNVTGPTEKLRITKDGYRTIPNQPYFKANKSAVISGTGVVVWNTVVYNQGGHYDSSNGRFTAPIDGLYWFSAKINAYDRCDFWLQKNGTRFERGQYNTDSDNVGWWSNQLTSIVEMTAGQYVEVYVSSLDQNTDPGEWLTFMGYLLY